MMSYGKACEIVDRRSSRRCERCGKHVFVGGSHHHRKLRSQGGEDCPSNLVFICGSGVTGCHGKVHARPAVALEQGWIVSRTDDPARVPLTASRYGDRIYLAVDGELFGTVPTVQARAMRAKQLGATLWPRTADEKGALR